MSEDLYLGIDMGGMQIKVAVVTSKGVREEETVMFTDIHEKFQNIKFCCLFSF
jgi:predicted NBD/HSP70 family sugar kinase